MDSRDYVDDKRYPEESDLQLDASEVPTDRAPTMRQEFKGGIEKVVEQFLKL